MSKGNFESDIPRVLVVENDLRWREDHQINLDRWQYHPYLAEGQGHELQLDAIRKAHKYRCHAALVDMRLLDHYDASDNSGLLLVPDLKPTRSIIITGYSSDHLVQSILKEQQADAVINKRRGSKPLKEALDASLQQICAAKKRIKIKWDDNLSREIIISSLLTKELSRDVPADEIDDLLGLLFPEAEILTIKKSDDLMSMENEDIVMLNVYVDESLESISIQICRKQDAKDDIKINNRVYLWDFAAQICS